MVKKKPVKNKDQHAAPPQNPGKKPANQLQGYPEDWRLTAEPARKLKRKLTKRVSFLDNVVRSHKLAIQKGGAKKHKRRKKTGPALGDLSSIAEALGVAESEIAGKQQTQLKGLAVRRAKARRKLAETETVRLQKVLAHPQFKKDPIAAVAEHLHATLPQPDMLLKLRKNVSGSQKQKARRQKARIESEMQS